MHLSKNVAEGKTPHATCLTTVAGGKRGYAPCKNTYSTLVVARIKECFIELYKTFTKMRWIQPSRHVEENNSSKRSSSSLFQLTHYRYMTHLSFTDRANALIKDQFYTHILPADTVKHRKVSQATYIYVWNDRLSVHRMVDAELHGMDLLHQKVTI